MKMRKVKMKNILRVTRITAGKHWYRRLSPFLLFALVLLLQFLILILTGKEEDWLEIWWLLVAIINLLFLDFVLWNYFEGKQKWRIWIIEFIASGLIIYLLM